MSLRYSLSAIFLFTCNTIFLYYKLRLFIDYKNLFCPGFVLLDFFKLADLLHQYADVHYWPISTRLALLMAQVPCEGLVTAGANCFSIIWTFSSSLPRSIINVFKSSPPLSMIRFLEVEELVCPTTRITTFDNLVHLWDHASSRSHFG